MGLTKQYLAYRPVDSFNVIASGRSNVNFVVYNGIEGRYVLVAAAENAIIWDLRLGERALTLRRDKQEVCAVRASPDHLHVAIGYTDGVVELFDLTEPDTAVCSLALHKSAVSVLRFDSEGMRLISGSLDTELMVVDVVEQAGRQRLIGHNAPVTDAHFLQRLVEQQVVVSCSKDTQIKFWNLETQFCFKTIVDNRTEVWALAFVENFLIAGCGESTMNVYKLRRRDADTVEGAVEGLSIDDNAGVSPISVSNCGELLRAGKGRTINLVADPSERVVCCHGTNDLIESFYFCTEEESKERLRKRLKRARKQARAKEAAESDKDGGGDAAEDVDMEFSETDMAKNLSLTDQIRRLENIKTRQKIKSIDVLVGGQNEVRVLASLANNSLLMYGMESSASAGRKSKNKGGIGEGDATTVKLLRSLTRLGHQSEVRSVCFSSDSLAIGSGAGESFKFWNRESMQCLRTVPTEYILCAVFVPGDRYALLGMKSGRMLIVDVGTGDVLEEIPAHDSELWSIAVLPDQKGCVTASGDSTVKVWTFELIDARGGDNTEDAAMTEDGEARTKVLSLLHKNTLKLEEAVLCVRVSPDMKFLAVGLLDSTVKVFFLDSFRFYLSLYGHKLPVLCLDISYDSHLIATGSADRNVKVWGLDFGDCHRSLFAHDDSVMGLQFIPKTHMFFTCGKDGRVKQWDGDTFDKILTLPGHIGEAYGLSVSPNGRYLVTCGSDRTLRLFERTEEPIVLQDVQEEEREEMENKQLATGQDSALPLLPGLKLASRKTVGAETAADSIMECLEICTRFEAEVEASEKPELHPLMLALQATNPDDFLLAVIARIRASDLEEALLLLTFENARALIQRMPRLVERRHDEVELLCKVTMFLFKVHLKTITSSRTLKPLLLQLIEKLRADVTAMRDTIGLNLYSLGLVQRRIEDEESCELFFEATQQRRKREKKRREATKRLFIEMR